MALTALQAHGEGLGAAKVGEYHGATTAQRFGDPQAELEALHAGCGVYDLGFRAKISLTGGDRVRWLNGMVTNNIRDLAVGRGVYAFLLNPQGHILGDLYAYNHADNRGESITVDTHCNQLEKILATFDHYIIMDDVEVVNLNEHLTALGIAGPGAQAALERAGFSVPAMQPLQTESATWQGQECTIVRGEDEKHTSYEVWVAPSSVRTIWDALRDAGAAPVGSEALELQRILLGWPTYGVDIRERDLPQETEQARALNFNKGCYVGQEIVERIRSRGAVHRKFTGFLAHGEAPIAAGMKIVAGEKEVGEVTSAAFVGRLAKTVALGFIRREVGTPGREVLIGSSPATVTALPVEDAAALADHSIAQQHAPA